MEIGASLGIVTIAKDSELPTGDVTVNIFASIISYGFKSDAYSITIHTDPQPSATDVEISDGDTEVENVAGIGGTGNNAFTAKVLPTGAAQDVTWGFDKSNPTYWDDGWLISFNSNEIITIASGSSLTEGEKTIKVIATSVAGDVASKTPKEVKITTVAAPVEKVFITAGDNSIEHIENVESTGTTAFKTEVRSKGTVSQDVTWDFDKTTDWDDNWGISIKNNLIHIDASSTLVQGEKTIKVIATSVADNTKKSDPWEVVISTKPRSVPGAIEIEYTGESTIECTKGKAFIADGEWSVNVTPSEADKRVIWWFSLDDNGTQVVPDNWELSIDDAWKLNIGADCAMDIDIEHQIYVNAKSELNQNIKTLTGTPIVIYVREEPTNVLSDTVEKSNSNIISNVLSHNIINTNSFARNNEAKKK